MPDQPDTPDLPADKHLNMGGDLTEALWDSDYQPVWLEDLPISAALRMRLEQWKKLADELEYYLPKKERAPFDLKGFTIAGLDIARCLKAELPGWRITYHDEYLWQHMDEMFLTNEQCQYDVTANAPLFPPWHELAKPVEESRGLPDTEPEHLPSWQLRKTYWKVKVQCPEILRLRIHRATSWLYRAETLKDEDADGCLISLWIALDSLHADSQTIQHSPAARQTALKAYLKKLLHHDPGETMRQTMGADLVAQMTTLVEDPYLFAPFWQHREGVAGCENWAKRLQSALTRYRDALHRQDMVTVLHHVSAALAVLRSQIMNGGATYQSMANRQAVEPAIAFLSALLPVFIRLMLDHPHADWTTPLYHVSNGNFLQQAAETDRATSSNFTVS